MPAAMKIASATQRSHRPPCKMPASTCRRPPAGTAAMRRIGQQVRQRQRARRHERSSMRRFMARNNTLPRLGVRRNITATLTAVANSGPCAMYRACVTRRDPLLVEEIVDLAGGFGVDPRHLARSATEARSIALSVPKWRSSARLRVGPMPGISCRPASRISRLAPRAVRADGEPVRLVAQPLARNRAADRAAAA